MQTMQEVIQKYKLKNLGGSDNFKNDEYDAIEWSAPIIQGPRILKEYLDASGIVGSTIKEIAIVHQNYSVYDRDIFYLKNEINNNFCIQCILEPVVIITDKGCYEFDFSESSTVRLTKDCLKPCMYAFENNLEVEKLDLRKTFSSLNGKQIIKFAIKEHDFDHADDDFTGSYGIRLDDGQESYIKELIFFTSDNRKLVFINDYDDGLLYLLDTDVEKDFKNW